MTLIEETALELQHVPSEQFHDHLQQKQTALLGVWVFLSTEVLFFGGLFAAFYVYRFTFTKDFAEAANELKWWLGGINTMVLLISSYFMAEAVSAARKGETKSIIRRLLLVAVLGFAFIGIKSTEYFLEYREGLFPWQEHFAADPHGKLFMIFYCITTGLHALHVTIGICCILVTALMAHRGWFTKEYHNPVEGVGLYWHFVDLVWVFLYPTLYLLRHP